MFKTLTKEFPKHYQIPKTLPNSQNTTKFTKHYQIHKTLPNSQNTTKLTKHYQINKTLNRTQNTRGMWGLGRSKIISRFFTALYWLSLGFHLS